MSILEVNGLKKVYSTRFGGNKVEALKNVNFSVSEGEYVAIMGESGSGKTTLLNILAALDRPTSGSVMIDGRDLSKIKDSAVCAFRRDNLGFVFQSFHLLPQLSARENIALPWRLNALPRRELCERVEALAEQLGIVRRLDALPRNLSGGEQQRVAVARALIHGPTLVLADEPTGSLDPERASDVLALLGQMGTAAGAAVLMVTHSAAAAAIAQRRLEMRRDGLHPL